MTTSSVNEDIVQIVKEMNQLIEKLEWLIEPRGGIKLAFVCPKCGILIDDEIVETIDVCPNCNCEFYEME